MHATKFVPIEGRITLDSYVEGQPDYTIRKMIEGLDARVKNALGEILEAQTEKARLFARIGNSD